MKSIPNVVALIAALTLAASAQSGPITKQNGSSPVLAPFTPICAVPGYADYGLCGGSTSTFSDVGGKLDAVQPKPGRYNLEFSFSGLAPFVEYKLLATRDAVPFGGTWVEIGRAVSDLGGVVSIKWQTTEPAGLGFDLNRVGGDVTITTSWWSGKKLVVNPDSSLGVGA
jgi:hypothetical protein